MFSKLLGNCLPGRKGRDRKGLITDIHREDPKSRTQVGADAKKDVDEAPEVCLKENTGAKTATEEPDQFASENRITETKMESEEGKSYEEKESGSLTKETPKADEWSPNESEENNEGGVMNAIDPQDEDYKWEVSCCGVDIPLAK